MGQVELGILAIGMGVVVGVLAFVPFVAVSYRRHGALTFRRFALAFAALVYFLAIWTYTLLPLPDPDAIRCTEAQLNPFAFVGDLAHAIATGSPFTDSGFLQLALNVLLFVPLGFLVRLIWHRGVLASLVVGFALSLLVETTQLTGVWGLYPCSYRVFDVDDLLTNTLGAVIGSMLALFIPLRYRVRDAEIADARLPRPVTRTRRLLGMLCDWLAVILTSAAAAVVAQIVLVLIGADDGGATEEFWTDLASIVVPLAISAGFLLIAGRTIGNAAVQLRFVGSRMPPLAAAVLRFLGGIGGFQLLLLLPDAWGLLTLPFAAASVILVFTTERGRGLPGLISGQRLVDSRVAPEGASDRADADEAPHAAPDAE